MLEGIERERLGMEKKKGKETGDEGRERERERECVRNQKGKKTGSEGRRDRVEESVRNQIVQHVEGGGFSCLDVVRWLGIVAWLGVTPATSAKRKQP